MQERCAKAQRRARAVGRVVSLSSVLRWVFWGDLVAHGSRAIPQRAPLGAAARPDAEKRRQRPPDVRQQLDDR